MWNGSIDMWNTGGIEEAGIERLGIVEGYGG